MPVKIFNNRNKIQHTVFKRYENNISLQSILYKYKCIQK